MSPLSGRHGPFDDFTAAVLLALDLPIDSHNRLVGSHKGTDLIRPLPGRWIPRVLLQGEVWIDAYADFHLVGDMSAEYREEVLDFLAEREAALVRQAHARIGKDARFGRIDGRERKRQERLVATLLTPGWTRRTPLGLSLRIPPATDTGGQD